MIISSFALIVLAIMMNVYGQLIMKWQVSSVEINGDLWDYVFFLFRPWVVSGFCAVFGGALLWLYALSKVDLSMAYPIMGLSFVFILFGSWVFFEEPLTATKIIGNLIIVLGVVVATR